MTPSRLTSESPMSPFSLILSPFSRLLSQASCLTSSVWRLLSPVSLSCLTSPVCLSFRVWFTSPVCLPSPVCLTSPVCLLSPVSHLLSHVYSLTFPVCLSSVFLTSPIFLRPPVSCLLSLCFMSPVCLSFSGCCMSPVSLLSPLFSPLSHVSCPLSHDNYFTSPVSYVSCLAHFSCLLSVWRFLSYITGTSPVSWLCVRVCAYVTTWRCQKIFYSKYFEIYTGTSTGNVSADLAL